MNWVVWYTQVEVEGNQILNSEHQSRPLKREVRVYVYLNLKRKSRIMQTALSPCLNVIESRLTV
jgi:hypothetical protein